MAFLCLFSSISIVVSCPPFLFAICARNKPEYPVAVPTSRIFLAPIPFALGYLVCYDNKKIVANVHVDRTEEQLASGDRQGVLDNIKLRCKVSHLLSSDLEIQYNILPLK